MTRLAVDHHQLGVGIALRRLRGRQSIDMAAQLVSQALQMNDLCLTIPDRRSAAGFSSVFQAAPLGCHVSLLDRDADSQ